MNKILVNKITFKNYILFLLVFSFACQSEPKYYDFIDNVDNAEEIINPITQLPSSFTDKKNDDDNLMVSLSRKDGKDVLYMEAWSESFPRGFELCPVNNEETLFTFNLMIPEIVPTIVHAHPPGRMQIEVFLKDSKNNMLIFGYNMRGLETGKAEKEFIISYQYSNGRVNLLQVPYEFPLDTWFYNSLEVKQGEMYFFTSDKVFSVVPERHVPFAEMRTFGFFINNGGVYYSDLEKDKSPINISSLSDYFGKIHLDYIFNQADVSSFETRKNSNLLKKVLIGTTFKNSLLSPDGSIYTYKLKVPENSGLSFSYGIIPVSWKNEHPTEFRIDIRNDGSSEVLFKDQLHPLVNSGHQSWQNAFLDLSRYGGKNVEISFKTEARYARQDNVSNRNLSYAAWGNPKIVSKIPSGEKKNVLLISLDTLRKDRLGVYNKDITFTPNIDAFARQCHAFTHAVSQSSWTSPSHMTMFTSLYTSQHNVYSVHHKLEETIITLAEILQQEGYMTAAVTGGGYVAGELGFNQGFDSYYDSYSKNIPEGMTEVEHNISLSIDWLERHKNNPFFLFLHTYEIHSPFNHYEFVDEKTKEKSEYFFKQDFYDKLYNPEAPYDIEETIEIVNKLYNGGIAFTDRALGLLFEYLENSGLYENTLVILTSDHGETMGEHKDIFPHRLFTHGHSLYEELVRVPLLIHLPGQKESIKAKKMVGLIDLFPTVCSLLELDIPDHCNGHSLFPLENYEENLLFMENHSEPQRYRRQVAVRTPEYKYIVSQNMEKFSQEFPHASIPESELYSLRDDPEESKNLAGFQLDLSRTFRETVISFMDAVQKESLRERTENLRRVNPELLKKLKSLGYLK